MTRITSIAIVFVITMFTAAPVLAQTASSEKAATANLPLPHLEFVGRESYEANGSKGMRFKLRVTNRANLPEFLWRQSANLPPCGKNENAARTWVEIFGSPGDQRLAGFCRLGSSEDLGQLWYVIPSGEKGPPCVYIVMTDRQAGRKYLSNRVCSRLLSLVTGTIKGSGQTQETKRDIYKGWIELNGWQVNESAVNVQGGSGSDTIVNRARGSKAQQTDSGAATDKKAAVAQPDLTISQFLFTPTNDKAVRVRVVNTGEGPSIACRLVLTVRKINGVAVGRTTQVNVPVLAAGAADWLHIDAKSILPNNVSLQSTTFRLNVDGTEIVAESNEANNEVWHNP